MSAALAAGAEATVFYAPMPEKAEQAERTHEGGNGRSDDVAAVYDRRPAAMEGNGGHRPPLQPESDRAASGVAALPDSESVNVWPDESAEAVFMAEARGRGEAVVPVAPETVTEVEEKAKPLPKLDDLVNRIPAETRELLEDLFRAKFTGVRRVAKKFLKE